MSETMFTYKGHNSAGTGVTGRAEGDVSAFVKDKYDSGWKDLVVQFGNGEEAGAICNHPFTGKRTWWSWR